MAKPDDLEAVRTISTALSGFSPEEQERILRWAREKIGLAPAARVPLEPRPAHLPAGAPPTRPDVPVPPVGGKDLKTFVNGKQPKSDVQFAATVAYYYQFEAPAQQRKTEIDATVLQDSCRLAGRARFNKPLATLFNAKKQGLLDSGGEKGRFTINTVGENLVAMTLPGQADASNKKKTPRKPTKHSPKK
jgi:hypothetical protein